MSIVIPTDAPRSVQEAFSELERRIRDLERAQGRVADDIIAATDAVADEAHRTAVVEAKKAAQWNPEFDVVRGGSGHTMGAAPDPGYHDRGGPRYLTSDGEWAPLLDGALVSADPGYAGTSLASKVAEVHGSLAITGALQADRVYSQYMNGRVVGCHVTNSTDTAIASQATPTVIPFDTTIFDSHGFHSNVTNNSRITIPTGLGGYYLVLAATRWEDVDDNDSYRAMRVEKNSDGTPNASNTYIQAISGQPTDDSTISIHLAGIVNLIAGDRIEMFCSQVSGTARNVQYVANGQSPSLTAIRLGW